MDVGCALGWSRAGMRMRAAKVKALRRCERTYTAHEGHARGEQLQKAGSSSRRATAEGGQLQKASTR